MKRTNALGLLAIGLLIMGGGATYKYQRLRMNSDPKCREAKASMQLYDGKPYIALTFNNLSSLCMQALGEKVGIKVSDDLSVQIYLNKNSNYYFIKSKDALSPQLRLKITNHTLGNTSSFSVGLPKDDASKLLNQKTVQLIPTSPTSILKHLELPIE